MNCCSSAVLPTPWAPSNRTLLMLSAPEDDASEWTLRLPAMVSGSPGQLLPLASEATLMLFRLNESPLLTSPLEEMAKFLTTQQSSAWSSLSCSSLAEIVSSNGILPVRARLCPFISAKSRLLLGRRIFFQELERLWGAEWHLKSESSLGTVRVISVGGTLLCGGSWQAGWGFMARLFWIWLARTALAGEDRLDPGLGDADRPLRCLGSLQLAVRRWWSVAAEVLRVCKAGEDGKDPRLWSASP